MTAIPVTGQLVSTYLSPSIEPTLRRFDATSSCATSSCATSLRSPAPHPGTTGQTDATGIVKRAARRGFRPEWPDGRRYHRARRVADIGSAPVVRTEMMAIEQRAQKPRRNAINRARYFVEVSTAARLSRPQAVAQSPLRRPQLGPTMQSQTPDRSSSASGRAHVPAGTRYVGEAGSEPAA